MSEVGPIDIDAIYNGDKTAIGDAIRYIQRALHGTVSIVGGTIQAGSVYLGGELRAAENIVARDVLAGSAEDPGRVEIGLINDPSGLIAVPNGSAGVKMGPTGAGSTDTFVLVTDEDTFNDKLQFLNQTQQTMGPALYAPTGGNTVFGPPTNRGSEVMTLGSATNAALRWDEIHVDRNKVFESSSSVGMGEWTTFTPTWTGATTNPTLGNGTLTGRYMRVGNTVAYHIHLTMGSTTTFGSGEWRFALPTAAANSVIDCHGVAILEDSGTRYYEAVAQQLTTTTIRLLYSDAVGSVSPTTPHTWAVNDTIVVKGLYEVA